MCAGKGTRWGDYKGVPKHLIEINGETLLGRTTRLLKENNIYNYIITTNDIRYKQYGFTRPQSYNDCEVDRFEETDDKEICYLYGDVYYYAKESDTKKTMDTIFITVFLILNTFFSIVLIFNMIGNKDRLEKCLIDIDYDKHVYKIILKFIANSLILVESYLIIFGKLPFPDEYIDLTYSATCLFVNLVYSINTKVIEETKKLIYSCCNHEKESHKRINTYEIQNSKNIKHSSNYDSYE